MASKEEDAVIKNSITKMSVDKEDAQKETEEKIPYPKAVFFLASNEFCERFCYYGMRTILSIYLTDYLLYSESDATVIYHTFIMLAYFFPVIGAIIADSLLGKFRTILYISFIYVAGNIILSLSSITPLGLPSREFSLLGLFLIALGTGGIKPCVAPFGGDQFVLPQQQKLIASYFALFYFAINLGSLISTAITPVLREDVYCFGEESCYSLAFGMSAILMICAIALLCIGRPFYKYVPAEDSLIIKVTKCIFHAVKEKIKSSNEKLEHWMDYSVKKYGLKLVEDIKATLKVLFMFLPMPLFWALVDQIGTSWTFQARRMDGYIGFYTILPDQMQLANSVLYLTWIPVTQYIIYPAFDKCRILTTPLQKITLGGVVTAFAFVASACVALALETTYPTLPSKGNGQIRIYNTLPCDVSISCPGINLSSFEITQGDFYTKIDLVVEGKIKYPYTLTSTCSNLTGEFTVYEEEAIGYYFVNVNTEPELIIDDVSKHEKGLPKIRFLTNTNGLHTHANITLINSRNVEKVSTNSTNTDVYKVNPGEYTIRIDNTEIDTHLYLGAVYAILVTVDNSSHYDINVVEVTAANSLHMLLLLPQYILLTFGELTFSIPGVEFSYSQSPIVMKSIVMSCWLLTTAVGNLIVVIVESAAIFELASYNMFFYASLMLVDMVIFGFMATRYKYTPIQKN